MPSRRIHDSQSGRGAPLPRFEGRLLTGIASALLTVCVVASFAGAFAQRSSALSQERREFRSVASGVASSMFLAINRDTEYVESLGSAVGAAPRMTNKQFTEYVARTHANVRYPGSLGYIYLKRVPDRRLAAFGRRLAADAPVGFQRGFRLIPPGRRSEYCIVRFGKSFQLGLNLPLGLDQCAAAVPGFVSKSPGRLYRAVQDSGEVGVGALDATNGLFGVAAPVYRGVRRPTSVAARRASLLGWAGGTFDGKAILTAAGGVRRGLKVEIAHRNPGEAAQVLAAAGVAGDRAHNYTAQRMSAGGVWLVRVTGSTPGSGLSATAQFAGVLLCGLTMSGLLFGLVFVLARGRSKALALVERKTVELRHRSLHDALTGLPNRACILDRIERALDHARRERSDLAVMFLDLDGFKGVNDTYGHSVGDELLRQVGRRLSGLLRGTDGVGRLGGDEFVVLVEGRELCDGPEAIAARVRAVLCEPFRLGGLRQLDVQVGASIGVATGLRASADELLRDADLALYAAKDAGKATFVLFEPAMSSALERRRDLEADLREAIGTDQIQLVYQPIFDLGSRKVTGVETLVRWQHPVRGLIMPDEFLTLAEESTLVVPLGRQILRAACAQATEWQRCGHQIPVSVNVSLRQLDSGATFVEDVRDALAASGLDAGSLTLEISEAALSQDAEASARHIYALKALGVRIALDNVGTGYSHLGVSSEFPIDALKIDRSVVVRIGADSHSAALVDSLIELSKTLGIDIVAEGIEHSGQLQDLEQTQCRAGQGFYFAHPLDAHALTDFVELDHHPLQ